MEDIYLMSEKKTTPVLNFIRRNFYYLLIGASLIIIATVIAIILATDNSGTIQGSNESTQSDSNRESTQSSARESSSESLSESVQESKPGQSEPNTNESVDDKPVNTQIIFTLPVANSSIIKSYTSSTVVYNQTLGVYTGHMGIDFGADAGASVVAAYGGKVESITSSYLKGTTVIIDHGNGLKSHYNSIDAAEGLSEGQSVAAGEVIGYVSDNNMQEYKDGPHLHFEVTLNGEWVDPDDYLMMAEK